MAFTLQHVVPWGRSFGEYERMFALSHGDLQRRIPGCGDGPASFNATATRRGSHVVSVDPLYAYDAADIRNRIDATYTEVAPSPHVSAVIDHLERLGRPARIEVVPYEFQRGGNQRLRILARRRIVE
jgi:hypothetical protein